MLDRSVPIGAGLLLLLGAQPAFSQDAPPVAKGPTGDDMITYYPPRAMDLGKEGRAVIKCKVTPELTVTDCVILSEDPSDLGFGAAAVKLSRLFKMKPQNKDGQSTAGADVTIPINFRLAAGPTPLDIWLTTLKLVSGPTSDDVERVRPPAFTRGGTVTVRCHVKTAARLPQAEKGAVYDCQAAKETPARQGLAKAALSLTPLMRFDPATLIEGDPKWTVDLDVSWAAKPAG
jgi:TonB family protein